MDRITCNYCGKQYSSELGNCPVCGSRNRSFEVQTQKVYDDVDYSAELGGVTGSKIRASGDAPSVKRNEINAKSAKKMNTAEYEDDEEARIPYWLKTVILIIAGLAVIVAAVFAVLSLDVFDFSGGIDKEPAASEEPAQASPAAPSSEPLVVTTPEPAATAAPTAAPAVTPDAGAAASPSPLDVPEEPDPVSTAAPEGGELLLPEGAAESGAQSDVECTSIYVNRTDITFFSRGEAYRLVATCEPFTADEFVKWESADPKVAKVDDSGNISAISGGTTSVSATCGDQVATCIVRCAFETVGEVMSMNYDDITFFSAGESTTLKVTEELTDEQEAAIVWASADTSVATVDQNGKVTAVSGGNVEITATSGDMVASCIVRVNMASASTTAEGAIEFSLNHSDVTLFNKGEYVQLKVEGSGADASAPVWNTKDSAVATVDSTGLVKAVGSGTTSVYTVVGGVTLSCIVRVNIS